MTELARYNPEACKNTVLLESTASLVTAISLATRVSIRCSSLFFDAMFEAAKASTSLSLGISRNALTNALSTAKNIHHSAITLNTDEHYRLVENIFLKVLERYTEIGLKAINHTFSLAELLVLSGIQFTARTVHSSLKAAEESIRLVDGIFGSNDTSRAIASIAALIHQELTHDPNFSLANAGRVAILTGLTKALTIFAVLQNFTHKYASRQSTIIWQGTVHRDTPLLIDTKKEEQIMFQEFCTALKGMPGNSLYQINTISRYTTERSTHLLPTDPTVNLSKNRISSTSKETQSFLAMITSEPQRTVLAQVLETQDYHQIYNKERRRYSFPQQMTRHHANIPISGKIAITTTATTTNFPRNHIVNNINHFIRYASAAYGESFMRLLGIGDIPVELPNSHHHHPNHHVFAHHTGNSVEDILLSSYTDRSPLHLHNPAIHALVHYVTVDHAAKAIVLTCRGTLGLSDVLTDLNCAYTEFTLSDHTESKDNSGGEKKFKAHNGMLNAAQLLAKEKGKVFQAIQKGLEKYPEYGLVLCGHSLAGGTVSLLSVLWSERKEIASQNLLLPHHTLLPEKKHVFVISKTSGLPPGRPIHCYAYGPPGPMDLELSSYCAGLVTTVVHANDVVSSLSLGLLQDFKNVANSLYAERDVTDEIISKIVSRLGPTSSLSKSSISEDEDQWFFALIKTLRADMKSEKMYPPSTVYLVESIPQTTGQDTVILSRCDDVQSYFSEIKFSRTMFSDHSPLMYEQTIAKLCKGYFTGNRKGEREKGT
ncbi:alpha/beta-hydrolase [Backusella circina FSU 941]|nr:alpha/beta-hydrolase [Backusella circina FSU 941]